MNFMHPWHGSAAALRFEDMAEEVLPRRRDENEPRATDDSMKLRLSSSPVLTPARNRGPLRRRYFPARRPVLLWPYQSEPGVNSIVRAEQGQAGLQA